MSHTCPGPECTQTVPDDMLMCRTHWYRVPQAIRNAVWRTWKNGDGTGSPAHNAAIGRAIESLHHTPEG